ncbi:MAG: CehA/McbA family metallohydrolase [Anaerolineae bacterium]|nr:CehA/McbA family metallohydrolase [Anaerolineae bacterium]
MILPHIPTPNGEPAALIATGRVDAVEMLDFLTYEHQEYYRYLNGGYRLPLVGGTDKMASGTPVGLYRTYVQLSPEEEFNYENWCKALRAGRTFLSGGALLWFTVEGSHPGDTITISNGATVEVKAEAQSIFPLHTLQIIQQGKVVAETNDLNGSKTLRLHEKIKITGDSWLAARCAGPSYQAYPHFDDRKRGIMAHTSPVYLTCGEEYQLFSAETAQYMLTLISGGLAYIRQRSPQYPPESVTHHHGLTDHLAELEKPFQEAIQAIHHRMHTLGISH